MIKFNFQLEGDWDEAISIIATLADPAKIAQVIDKVTHAEAKFAAKEIKAGILSQAPGGKQYPPLKRTTLQARRVAEIAGSKRLVATEATLRNITVKKINRGYWVGVPNRVVDGRNLADVFEANERGATIVQTVTKRMRGFLGARFGKAPSVGAEIVIRIPAAPTLEPIFQAVFTGSRVRIRVQRRTTRLINKLTRGAASS